MFGKDPRSGRQVSSVYKAFPVESYSLKPKGKVRVTLLKWIWKIKKGEHRRIVIAGHSRCLSKKLVPTPTPIPEDRNNANKLAKQFGLADGSSLIQCFPHLAIPAFGLEKISLINNINSLFSKRLRRRIHVNICKNEVTLISRDSSLYSIATSFVISYSSSGGLPTESLWV